MSINLSKYDALFSLSSQVAWSKNSNKLAQISFELSRFSSDEKNILISQFNDLSFELSRFFSNKNCDPLIVDAISNLGDDARSDFISEIIGSGRDTVELILSGDVSTVKYFANNYKESFAYIFSSDFSNSIANTATADFNAETESVVANLINKNANTYDGVVDMEKVYDFNAETESMVAILIHKIANTYDGIVDMEKVYDFKEKFNNISFIYHIFDSVSNSQISLNPVLTSMSDDDKKLTSLMDSLVMGANYKEGSSSTMTFSEILKGVENYATKRNQLSEMVRLVHENRIIDNPAEIKSKIRQSLSSSFKR